jgi:hypothetical protein
LIPVGAMTVFGLGSAPSTARYDKSKRFATVGGE